MKKYKIFVGIDISKGWIDVAVLNSDASAYRRFDNTRKGYRSMLCWLKSFAKMDEMLLCMEHTGVYGFPLWNYLAEKNICFVVENGLQIKQSMGIRRGKSDKTDAQIIARYIKLHHTETRLHKVPAQIISRLKVAFGHRERLLKIRHLLTVANKEISGFMPGAVCKEMSCDSKTLVKAINDRIHKVEKLILDLLLSDVETKRIYELIISVPGVGTITGAYLIIVTQNFTIINNSRKLSRYGGMSPEKNESGIRKRKEKVSSIGNKKLKALLSNCVGTNLKYDIETKEYHQRKLLQGKPEGVIINNLKNKILHRVCAVVNRGTKYVDIKKYGRPGKAA
jgi:transposase